VPIPLVRHPESVTIVPVDGDEIVLVRQTRPGAGRRVVELPAGTIEPGESAAEAARRELAEECRLGARTWSELRGFWVVPAYSTEFAHVFVARDLYPVAARPVDDDEDIEVERVPAAEARDRVEDAGSLAALALFCARPSL
jgi:ADP-ribose pyrophosphatase